MHKPFLITAVLFCVATAALAVGHKKDAQPQSKQAEPTQMARNDADGSMDHVSAAKSGDAHKRGKHSKRRIQQGDPEGDFQASQNQVEYGGG